MGGGGAPECTGANPSVDGGFTGQRTTPLSLLPLLHRPLNPYPDCVGTTTITNSNTTLPKLLPPHLKTSLGSSRVRGEEREEKKTK